MMHKHLRIAAVVLFVLSLEPNLALAKVVELPAGQLQGQDLAGSTRYLGVPYAAPPVGPLRWRAPQPVMKWQGIRSALEPASGCAQIGGFYASDDETVFDRVYGSEDCLYLNIWAPSESVQNKPVLIFFHGGSGIVGDASHPMYDGARLADATQAVVITANYRLGVLGSLQSPALHSGNPAEDSGNFFLLDMIQVLDWVADNCPALGCDSDNIAISGQSAGAVAVLALLRSPLATGKFHKAISFSGLPFSGGLKKAQERTEKLLTALRLETGHADNEEQAQEQLSALTDEELGEYLRQQTTASLLAASGNGLPPAWYADGTVLIDQDKPNKPSASVVNQVPLMIGKTRDEMSTLIPIKNKGRSAIKLWPWVNGEPRDQTIRQQLGFFSGLGRGMKVGLADWLVNRKIRKFEARYAQQLPAVYVYRFNWDNYPDPWHKDFGSFHALDIPFIFGNFIDDRKIYMRFAWTQANQAEREALHQAISAGIRAFVHNTHPNNKNAPWKAWDTEEYVQIWN